LKEGRSVVLFMFLIAVYFTYLYLSHHTRDNFSTKNPLYRVGRKTAPVFQKM